MMRADKMMQRSLTWAFNLRLSFERILITLIRKVSAVAERQLPKVSEAPVDVAFMQNERKMKICVALSTSDTVTR